MVRKFIKMKGKLKKTETGWVIEHKIIDPYGQIPNPIKLHPDYVKYYLLDEDAEGSDIEFEIAYEYCAKLIKQKI